MTILEFQDKKNRGQKLSMVTCYDSTFAKLLAETPVDSLLVGDSLAMVMHGHETTLNASLSLMALHTAAVKRGAPQKLLIADLPFLATRKGLRPHMEAVEKLMKAGAHAVKIEGALGHLSLIQHTVESGVPVMGHLGLTPQSIHQLGGFRVQGREEKAALALIEQAHQLEEVGCFGLVLECVPSPVATKIAKSLKIPVIGIGAGVEVDGQVLVLQDLLGLNPGFRPKFLRVYDELGDRVKKAVTHYHEDVQTSQFPSAKESYT